MTKTRCKPLLVALAALVLFASHLYAQQTERSALNLDRIFSSKEFQSETFGPARWIDDGAAYTTLEPSAKEKEARDIIRYDAASGQRNVLIAADSLKPAGPSGALSITNSP